MVECHNKFVLDSIVCVNLSELDKSGDVRGFPLLILCLLMLIIVSNKHKVMFDRRKVPRSYCSSKTLCSQNIF